jgi:hypothetical protein
MPISSSDIGAPKMVRAELMAGTDEYDEVAPFRAKMLVEHKAYQGTSVPRRSKIRLLMSQLDQIATESDA